MGMGRSPWGYPDLSWGCLQVSAANPGDRTPWLRLSSPQRRGPELGCQQPVSAADDCAAARNRCIHVAAVGAGRGAAAAPS